jgi:archaeal type IV pilus assembly protein PilA
MMFSAEGGVSPVIGVMLMLAITIIIASTVAAFAGGASTGFEKAPTASFSVYCDGSDDDFNIIFEHLGGDPVSSGDLKIVTWIEDGNGNVFKSDHTAKSPPSSYTSEEVRLPYVYDSQGGISADSGSEFGDSLWKPGTVAGTLDLGATAGFLDIPENDLVGFIESGTPVEVTIIHLPSGNTILRTEFILRES